VLLTVLPRSTIAAAIAAGIALGILSLVKPHALALALGCGLFLALRKGRLWSRTLAVIGTGTAFFLTRLGVGYTLSGTIDLSLTGPAYAATLVGGWPKLATIASYTAGHVASVALLAGMPLAAIVFDVLRGVRSAASREKTLDDLLLLAPCLLAALLAMTVYFSCSIHMLDPVSEPDTRLHGRYYLFALPLVMLAYAAFLQADRKANAKALFDTVGLLAWGGITLAASELIAVRYPGSLIDYPDLAVMRLGQTGPVVVVVVLSTVVAVALWRRKTDKEDRTWWHLLPLAWWASVASLTTSVILAAPLIGKIAPTAVDRAMETEVMRTLRGRDDGLVIGSAATAVDTYRVMFHLASRSGGRLIDPGAPIDPQTLTDGVRWLILMPGISYSGPGTRTRVEPLTQVALP
jgi:phosphoglycerol transferase